MKEDGGAGCPPAIPPDLAAIRAAAARIAGAGPPHPGRSPAAASTGGGAHLFFKCENLQRVGAFKFRGRRERGVLAVRGGGRARGGDALVGQPRPGPGAGGAPAAVPAWMVMPAHGAGREGRGGGRLRRRGSCPASRRWPRARRRSPRWCATPAPRSCTRTTTRGSSPARARRPSSCSRRCPLDVIIAPVGGGGLRPARPRPRVHLARDVACSRRAGGRGRRVPLGPRRPHPPLRPTPDGRATAC